MAKDAVDTTQGYLPTITAEDKEELSFLRQQLNSTMIRGHYRECFKMVEDNLRLLYFKERWPQNFYNTLIMHKRCYASMGIGQTYEEYLTALLRKHGIPIAFVSLLKGSSTSIDWSADFFKQCALVSENKGDYEEALGYLDLMVKSDPLNSNAHLLRGWVLDELDRGDEALLCFQRALELNRTNYQASCALAEYYIKHDLKKAEDYISEAIALAPSEPGFRAVQAKVYAAQGERQKAVAAYDEAIARDPRNAGYHYDKAELLLAEGQQLAAITEYGKAVGADPGHIPSLLRLSNLLSETQPELALPYINTVVTRQPGDIPANLLKARLLDKAGGRGAAARQYRKVLDLQPDNADAHAALGRLYLLDDPQRAVGCYERALELGGSTSEYHLGKAQAHQKLEENELAIREYKTAITSDKSNARAYAALGELYREPEPKTALGYFGKAAELKPDNPYYLQSKGELIMSTSGNRNAAMECYIQALQNEKANATLHLQIAQLLEEMGNAASAIDHYRKAINVNPEMDAAYYGLAKLLMDTEPDVALLHINSAIDLNSTQGEYYFIKAKILRLLGQNRDAIQQLMRSLARDGGNVEAMQEIGLLMSENSPRIALLYINRAVEMMPDNAVYLCERAALLASLGEIGNALQQYDEALVLDGNCHQGWYGAGLLLSDKGDPDALKYLDSAIVLAPDVAEYHYAKAKLLSRDATRYEEALECYDKATARDTRRWDILLSKAQLMEEHGDSLGAVESYRRVLLLNPQSLEANERLGMLLADLNPAAALRYLEKAQELNPGNYHYEVWQGRILYNEGDEAAAEEHYRRALQLGGESDEVYFTLAQVVSQRLPETGLMYTHKAMEINRENAEYPLLCGQIHLQLGERDDARACFEQTLAINSKMDRALEQLAQLRLGAGDASCLELMNAALAIRPDNADYLYDKARMMLRFDQDPLEAMEPLRAAIRIRPSELAFRELRVELLGKARKPVQRLLEKRRTDKLRAQLEQAEQAVREAQADEL